MPNTNSSLSLNLAALIVLLAGMAWSLWVVQLLWRAGDEMIGFHPAVLTYPLSILLSASIALAGAFMRRWRVFSMGLLGVAIPICLIASAHRVSIWSWENSLNRFDAKNKSALSEAALVRTISPDESSEIYKDELLTPIKGFQWHTEHHIAAPGNVFRAFQMNGTPHVRIQKIRHGYRGIAMIRHPDELAALNANGTIKYEATSNPNWVIWTKQ